MKLFGSLTAISFSPIVTIEPRRRKFHCPIKLKIPLPAGYQLETSGNLRLLCSITGGQSKAIWEDVTGSTPLSIHEKCLLFTTTVSARFWLVHCQRSQRCQDAARFAQELWRYMVQVPFMAKFVVFAKRRDINEAQVRVFCMTDDKEEKTLECQEHYTLVARSRDVEVLDGQMLYLEFGGTLIPAHLNGAAARQRDWQGGYTRGGRPNSGLLVANSSVLLNEQLAFAFRAFQENRLAFACRLREVGQEPTGRIAFMEDSLKYLASLDAQQRAYLSERRRRAVCTLGIQLPAMCVHYDNILGTPKRNSYYANARIGDLSLADIASELNLKPLPLTNRTFAEQQQPVLDGSRPQIFVSGSDLSTMSSTTAATPAARRPDWMELAPRLGIPRDEVEFIAEHCGTDSKTGAGVTPALLLLMHWYRLASPDDRDQDLARGLLAIGREDIAQKLNFPIEPKRISRSTAELLREIEMIPVRSTENLHGYGGSDISGYTAGGYRNYRAASSTRAGSSLRRLNDINNQEQRDDQSPSNATRAADYEQQRRRAGSTSSIQRSQQPPVDARQNYFSSGLRNTGQPYDDEHEARVTKVPAIEVSRANEQLESNNNTEQPLDRLDDKMADDKLPQDATVGRDASSIRSAQQAQQPETSSSTSVVHGQSNAVATSNSIRSGRQQQMAQTSSDGDSLRLDQRRSIVEQLAQSLVDDVLDDAYEHYLRRELQQTAEETVREALAAAGAGRAKMDGANKLGDTVESTSKSAGHFGKQLVDADDMYPGDDEEDFEDEDGDGDDEDNGESEEDEEGEAERTLTHGSHLMEIGGDQADLRAYSTSPSRLDGGDIFQDLSEMSNFADRIDSILDQTVSEHSTRSGRMRSVSPMPQMVIDQQDDGVDGGDEVD